MGLVNFFAGALTALIVLILSVGTSGCGFAKSIWGEQNPAQKTIALTAGSIPPFVEVLNSPDDQYSNDLLEEYKNNALDSFSKIKGDTPNYLSLEEIEVLIRKKLVKLADTESTSIARVRSILLLLGFEKGIHRTNVENIFKWLADNRADLRVFYTLFLTEDPVKAILDSGKLAQMINLFGAFAALGGHDTMPLEKFSEAIIPWIPKDHPYAVKATPSTVQLASAFFSSLCGDRIPFRSWNGHDLGACLQGLARHFAPTLPMMNFVLGQLDPLENTPELLASNKQLVPLIESWLKDHQHPRFSVSTISQLSHDLDIPRPYHFFKLTEWLPKLNADSTVFDVSPTLITDFARILQKSISSFLAALPKNQKRLCLSSDWRGCKYTGAFDPLTQLLNDEYATLLRSKDLRLVYHLSLYDSLAGYLMDRMDLDHDGYLEDQVKELITVAIRVIDSHAFMDSVVNRFMQKPVILSSTEASLKDLRRQGLSELAALAANIIPNRENGSGRSVLSKLGSHIYFGKHGIPNLIDRIGLTSFLYLYNLTGSLRASYLKDFDLPVTEVSPSVLMVPRRKIVASLPSILYYHFPRLYNTCLDWGFERTCGVAFTEVLSGPNPGFDSLETYEMDVITVVSIFLESMLSRCDRNEDDLLSTDALDAYDEKTCVLKITRALAMRLMSAGILDQDKKIEYLTYLVADTRIFRGVGKQAMAQGTMKGLGWNIWRETPLLSALTARAASMGSTLSLAAELMDPDKVDAIGADKMGPHDDIGDELIYLNQLTKYHLPRKGEAPRTSESYRERKKLGLAE